MPLRRRWSRATQAVAPDEIAIAGYHVAAVIGVGRLGPLYRAVQQPLKREVALRVLSPGGGQPRRDTIERFLRLAAAWRTVHHEHVAACFDAGSDHGVAYQAIEPCSGAALSEMLSGHGALPIKQALRIALDCARGLEAIHTAGLAHLHLRPTNVFVAAEGAAKLTDVGLSPPIMLAEAGAVPRWRASDLPYLAPEMGDATPQADQRSDLYALGALLWEMSVGTAPPPAERGSRTPDPRTVNAAVPAPVAAVVRAAMAHAAGDRYASSAQLREDLERLFYDFSPIHARRVANPTPPPEDGDGVPTTPGEARRRGTLIWISLAIALAAGVGVGAMALRSAATDLPDEHLPVVDTGMPASPTTAAPTSGPGPTAPEAVASWAAAQGQDEFGRWRDLEVDGVSQRLRWCPPGTFWLGSPPDEDARREDERRVLTTLTHGFWIGDCEVTQELWQATLRDTPSRFHGRTLPVESIGWQRAQDFLRALSSRLGVVARLPTEAEWEYACRAGSTQGFARVPAEICWSLETAGRATQPVKALMPNAWGLFDMHGNVLEWCQDTYAPYPVGEVIDPVTLLGVQRVARGGAWTLPAADCRSATRTYYLPSTRFFFLGLRLVIDEP